jgi:hypothetical protein
VPIFRAALHAAESVENGPSVRLALGTGFRPDQKSLPFGATKKVPVLRILEAFDSSVFMDNIELSGTQVITKTNHLFVIFILLWQIRPATLSSQP